MPHEGKYFQQCEFCGHPKHIGNDCGVGVVRAIPMMTDQAPLFKEKIFVKTTGCRCQEGRYEGKKLNLGWIY